MGPRDTRIFALVVVLGASAGAASAEDVPGDYAIAGTDAEELFFEDVAGWTVLRAETAEKSYCVAETGLGDDILRLGTDGAIWQVAVRHGTGAEWTGFLDVDGWNRAATGASVGDWAIAPIDAPILDHVAAGQVLTIDLGTGPWRYSLSGAPDAIATVERCTATAGQSARAPSVK